MRKLLNLMKLQSGLASQSHSMRIGLVSSYDPANYSVKVLIQPEDVETGWMPISSEWAGNGWGLFAPPTVGAMVQVEFLEGDFEAGIVTKQFFNDEDRPLSVPSGEFWLVHKSGSALKFHNDGSVELNANTNLTATVGGNLNANVTGNAVIKAAAIKLQNAGTSLLNLLNSLFSTWAASHTHTCASPGSQSGPPSVLPPANTQTTIVQAE